MRLCNKKNYKNCKESKRKIAAAKKKEEKTSEVSVGYCGFTYMLLCCNFRQKRDSNASYLFVKTLTNGFTFCH